MTESPTLTQTAPSQTGPSMERSQGLDLGKSVIVPYMHIKETLQKNQYGQDTGRDVTYAELSAAAHRQGYGLNETDARVHGLLDGSRPTTLANYQKLSSEATLRSLGREFKGYAASVGDAILHPQDTADKALKGLDQLRNDVRTAGMQRAQEGYDMQVNGAPSAVGATLGVVVETSTRVVNAGAAGVLGLAQLAVHPVESVKSAADAALSPIETGKKLHNWYEKSSAADVGEGMLTVLTGAKAAPAMNAAAVSTAKAVAAIPVVAKTGAAIGEAAAPAIAAVKASPTVVATATAVQPAVQAVTTGAKAVNSTVIQPVRNAYNKVEQGANDAYAAVVDGAKSAVTNGAEVIKNTLGRKPVPAEGETTGPSKDTSHDAPTPHETPTLEMRLNQAQLDLDVAHKQWDELDAVYDKATAQLSDAEFVKYVNGLFEERINDQAVPPELKALHDQRLALGQHIDALRENVHSLELALDLRSEFQMPHAWATHGAAATDSTSSRTLTAMPADDALLRADYYDPVYKNTFYAEGMEPTRKSTPVVHHDLAQPSEWFAIHKASDYYIKGDLTDGKLGFNIEATNQAMRNEHGGGSVLFDKMIAHFGKENIREIEGFWGDSGPLADNGKNFIKMLSADGIEPLGAAANTWTGKMAQRHGYDIAEVYVSLSKLDGESHIRSTYRRPDTETGKSEATERAQSADPRTAHLDSFTDAMEAISRRANEQLKSFDARARANNEELSASGQSERAGLLIMVQQSEEILQNPVFRSQSFVRLQEEIIKTGADILSGKEIPKFQQADLQKLLTDPHRYESVYRQSWQTDKAALVPEKTHQIAKDSDEFHFQRTRDYFISGYLVDGNLEFTVLAKNESMKAMHGNGSALFDRMIDYFGKEKINTIQGSWADGEWLADNGKTFIKLLSDGHTPLDAAPRTWTGKMAEKHGFELTEVQVLLSKLDEHSWIGATFKRADVAQKTPAE